LEKNIIDLEKREMSLGLRLVALSRVLIIINTRYTINTYVLILLIVPISIDLLTRIKNRGLFYLDKKKN